MIAVIVPDQPVYVRTYSFIGGRAMVKFQATQAALDRVRRMLELAVNSFPLPASSFQLPASGFRLFGFGSRFSGLRSWAGLGD